MSALADQITNDIKTAMRERNKAALNVLRALKAALTNTAIEKSGVDAELTESEVIKVIRKQIKQRQDSVEQFEKADRTELAENEKEEIRVLETYLPAAMTEADIITAVDAAITESAAESRKDIGKVMQILQEKTGGLADGKTLSQEVMKRLS